MGEIQRDVIDRQFDNFFFCHGCLQGQPFSEQSPDFRYCRGCYEFLLKEAGNLSAGKRPGWIPKAPELSDKPTQQATVCNRTNTGVPARVEDVTDNPRRCELCSEAFRAARKDARYCSVKCRVAAHRKEFAS